MLTREERRIGAIGNAHYPWIIKQPSFPGASGVLHIRLHHGARLLRRRLNSLSSRLMLSAASIISSTSDCDTGRFGVLAWMDSLRLSAPPRPSGNSPPRLVVLDALLRQTLRRSSSSRVSPFPFAACSQAAKSAPTAEDALHEVARALPLELPLACG